MNIAKRTSRLVTAGALLAGLAGAAGPHGTDVDGGGAGRARDATHGPGVGRDVAGVVAYENRAAAGFTANTTLLLWWNGNIYSHNSAGTWYEWTPGSYYWPQAGGDTRGSSSSSSLSNSSSISSSSSSSSFTPGTPVLVQHVSANSSRSTAITNSTVPTGTAYSYVYQLPGAGTQAGNAVTIQCTYTNNVTPSVTDDVGNTYSLLVKSSNSSRNVAILGSFNVKGWGTRTQIGFLQRPRSVGPANRDRMGQRRRLGYQQQCHRHRHRDLWRQSDANQLW